MNYQIGYAQYMGDDMWNEVDSILIRPIEDILAMVFGKYGYRILDYGDNELSGLVYVPDGDISRLASIRTFLLTQDAVFECDVSDMDDNILFFHIRLNYVRERVHGLDVKVPLPLTVFLPIEEIVESFSALLYWGLAELTLSIVGDEVHIFVPGMELDIMDTAFDDFSSNTGLSFYAVKQRADGKTYIFVETKGDELEYVYSS